MSLRDQIYNKRLLVPAFHAGTRSLSIISPLIVQSYSDGWGGGNCPVGGITG